MFVLGTGKGMRGVLLPRQKYIDNPSYCGKKENIIFASNQLYRRLPYKYYMMT